MLGDAVSRSFGAVWPQEIFHDQHADPEIDFKASVDIGKRLNFFNFRHDTLKRRPELSLPSTANQSLILSEYLEYIASSEKSDRYLLDIKYTSWHHLDPYWRALSDPPYLLSQVKRLRLPLVHLKRSNLFALYCSKQLAAQSSVWHVFEDRTGADHHLTIDVASCVRELDDMRTTQRLFERWLSGYPVRELEYESLLADSEFSKDVEQTFARIYGISPVQPLSTLHRKVTPPLRHVVLNKDEVLSALAGTDFQAMAEEALS
jgi:hypothetical protein